MANAPATAGENFLYIFKGGPPGRHAGAFTGSPRLAASLPARAGNVQREPGGHARAPESTTKVDPGLTPLA